EEQRAQAVLGEAARAREPADAAADHADVDLLVARERRAGLVRRVEPERCRRLHSHGEVGEATSVTHAPVDTGLRTLPYRWYTDPRVAEIERDRIFRRTWQYAGHLRELAGPGSFFPTRVGGLPVVVTRDGEDVLRAFVNVCRHRGALVATGA